MCDEYEATVSSADTKAIFVERAQRLADEAREAGFVLTIEQIPVHPLAMGNHKDQVSIREIQEY